MAKTERILYGLLWPELMAKAAIEIEMIRRGGKIIKKNGDIAGFGLFYHYKALQQELWPNKIWHKWNELLLKEFIENRITGIMGPAASGKTRESSDFFLSDYYCFPDCTTVLVSSTEREMLEMRAWGEIKRSHIEAQRKFSWLPGQLIESRQRIVTDERAIELEGRDFRNGMVGVPCKKGGNYVGLGSYAGIHNKRVGLLADEGQLMPQVYVDAISNLNKTENFKAVVLGNPKDITDALGKVCEPSAEMGGWDSGIDQAGGTKTWQIRFPQSKCVQLVGSDSPNLDGKLGAPLITQEQIDADVKFYGKDSLQFTMMNEGRMPRGQSMRRIITRPMCVKGFALEDPVWKDENQLNIGSLDAAYGGVGGDRTVLIHLKMGKGLDYDGSEFQQLAVMLSMVVPVRSSETDDPEEQIAEFTKEQCESIGISPYNFFFDSTGRGSLMNAFCRLWSPNVQGIEFGGTPSSRPVSNEIHTLCNEYYAKKVAELWYSVRLAIQSRQIRGLTEDIMQEGCMREWTFSGKNKIDIEPKKNTKLRMGRSPDLFDALVCGVEGARCRGFVISKLSSGIVQESKDNAWKQKLRQRAAELVKGGQLNYVA